MPGKDLGKIRKILKKIFLKCVKYEDSGPAIYYYFYGSHYWAKNVTFGVVRKCILQSLGRMQNL